MFASPDGLDGVDAKMLVLVSRVVTLNMATVFKNVPLLVAALPPPSPRPSDMVELPILNVVGYYCTTC